MISFMKWLTLAQPSATMAWPHGLLVATVLHVPLRDENEKMRGDGTCRGLQSTAISLYSIRSPQRSARDVHQPEATDAQIPRRVLDEQPGALRSGNRRRRAGAADREDRSLQGGVRAMLSAEREAHNMVGQILEL